MKKALCIGLLFVLIAGLAACAKKKQVFVEPPTEIETLENGETVVYEIVTDEKGVAVTDGQGETKRVVYDPPVTEKGGYLVTDAQGSTIKQSQTTEPVSREVAIGDLDVEDSVTLPAKPGQTNADESKPVQTNAAGETVSNAQTTIPAGSTVPTTSGSAKPVTTVPVTGIVGQTNAVTGTLSTKEAQKLIKILEIENKFDENLCDGDFAAAKSSVDTYITAIEKSIALIKADEKLHAFVGDGNLTMWLTNMLEAKQKYLAFSAVEEQERNLPKKSTIYITSYNDFQNSYRKSLEAYYCMMSAAERLV